MLDLSLSTSANAPERKCTLNQIQLYEVDIFLQLSFYYFKVTIFVPTQKLNITNAFTHLNRDDSFVIAFKVFCFLRF
jgi:hypothetical protein